MIKYNTPQELFTAICDKIRDKTNSNELINHQDIPDKIDKLTSNDIKLFIDSAIQGKNTICYSFNNTTITKISSTIFNTTNLTNIDLPECTSICSMAFQNCTNLTTIDLPECSSIGYSAFNSCTNLTTVNLPKCTTLGYQTFSGCYNLTTVNLPKCTSAGMGPGSENYGSFYNCNNLTIVILGDGLVSNLPPMFGNTPIKNGTGYIYVPDNVLNEYKTNNPDYQFKPISELPSNLKEEYGYE